MNESISAARFSRPADPVAGTAALLLIDSVPLVNPLTVYCQPKPTLLSINTRGIVNYIQHYCQSKPVTLSTTFDTIVNTHTLDCQLCPFNRRVPFEHGQTSGARRQTTWTERLFLTPHDGDNAELPKTLSSQPEAVRYFFATVRSFRERLRRSATESKVPRSIFARLFMSFPGILLSSISLCALFTPSSSSSIGGKAAARQQ